MPLLPLVPALAMALAPDGLDGTPSVPLPFVGVGADWDVGIAAAGEGGTALRGGALGADGYVEYGNTEPWHDAIAGAAIATGGSINLRTGDVPWLGAEHWARAYLMLPPGVAGGPDAGTGLTGIDAEHRFEVGAVPPLFARKDAPRGAYGREELGATGHVSVGDRSIEFGFAQAWSWADGVPRHDQIGFHGGFVLDCLARDEGLPERCVELAGFQALVVEGGSSAVITTIEPVRARGLHVAGPLYVDLGGGVAGTGSFTESTDTGTTVIETSDLPRIRAGLYDVHAYTPSGDVDARAHRTIYLTLDGDLAIEDRAEAAVAWGDRTRVTLRGFAARTAWWTSKTDPGTAAVTGGGEVDVSRTDAGLAWNASLGVARSFYATLDGAPADLPALGARGALEVRRALRRRPRTVTALSE